MGKSREAMPDTGCGSRRQTQAVKTRFRRTTADGGFSGPGNSPIASALPDRTLHYTDWMDFGQRSGERRA
jgi:hypothetical protein